MVVKITDIPRVKSTGGSAVKTLTGDSKDNKDDKIDGGYGSQTINGGAGNDTLWGGLNSNAPDTLNGGTGDDILFGENGDDILKGGDDSDTLWGGEGHDDLFGGDDRDYIYGENGEDVIEGEDGNDYLYGGGHNDKVIGGIGNDTVSGGSGSDVLEGGKGIDKIHLGIDKVKDIIDFKKGDMGKLADSTDTVYDFVSGIDKIQLFGLGLGKEYLWIENVDDFFIPGAKKIGFFSGALYIDIDGNGHSNYQIVFDSGKVAGNDIAFF